MTQLVEASSIVSNLAVDDTSVYYATYTGLWKVRGEGGAPMMLAPAAGKTFAWVAVSGGYLYAAGEGAVVRVPVAGGASSSMLSGNGRVDGLVVDATRVYIATGASILTTLIASGTTTVLVAKQGGSDLCANAANLYWTGADASGTQSLVRSIAKSGGTVSNLATMQSFRITGLAVAGSDVYWSTQNTIRTAPANDVFYQGSATEKPSRLAADGKFVYWLDGTAVAKLGVGAFNRTLIASGQAGLESIAVDDDNIYWVKGPPVARVIMRASPK